MSHSDIYNTSYGRKKGHESNWQFDSRPQKVGNQPDPGVCKWSVTHRRKALEESYKFASDLIPIQGLSPGNKNHLDAGAAEQHREYYMGEGGGFP